MTYRLKLLAASLTIYALAFALIATAAYGQTSNGRVTTNAPTYTNGTAAPLSLDTDGGLRVNCVTGCAGSGGAQDVNITAVGGNAVTTTVPVSGTVTATGPLTDAQLRATPVPVSGTVTATGPLTDAQLRATPVDVGIAAPLPAGTNNIGDVDVLSAPGTGSTGSAPPATAVYLGARGGSGNLSGLISCNASAIYSASTNGNTQLVALASGQTIYVCGYSILAGGTVNVRLVYGTGTACATGETSMTPTYQLTAQAGIVDGASFWRGLSTASANALCIETSAGVAVQAIVYYVQF